MKIKYFGILFAMALTVRASTVAEWTFETNYTASPNGVNSLVQLAEIGTGSLWAHHASAIAAYSAPAGNGSAVAFSSDHWSVGDYFEFQTATTGFTNITVSFDQYRSGTGPTNWDFEYSLDGASFSTVFSYSITNSPSWIPTTYHSSYTFNVDLITILSVADNPAVYFRLVDDSAPAGTAGTSRLDNVSVNGSTFTVPVPEPAISSFIALGAGVLFVLFRRNLDSRS